MDHDSRRSVHEIGTAREMAMAPGSPKVVLVSTPSSSEGTPPYRVGHRVSHGTDHGQEQVEQIKCSSPHMVSGNMVRSGLLRRNTGPRVAFVGEDDDWSLFSNPECSHERHCGHIVAPRILFRPDGVGPLGRVDGPVATTDSEPTLPATEKTTFRILRKAQHQDLLLRVAKSLLTDPEKEYFAARTADWVGNTSPDFLTVPNHNSPLSTPESYDTETSEIMGNFQEHQKNSKETPIRGNFIPLKSSIKERSPSPRREQGPHDVYLQLSLTDSQMDRLTAVLSPEGEHEPLPRGRDRNADEHVETTKSSSKETTATRMRSRSPAKTYSSNTTPSRARSRSPVKFKLTKTPEGQRTLQGFNDITESQRKAQEARVERTPTAHETPSRAGGRGTKGPPAPIDTDLARAHAKMAALRVGPPAVVVHNPPERSSSPVRHKSQHVVVQHVMADDSSSHYSQDSAGERHSSCVSPLRLQKHHEPKHVSILKEYTESKNSARGSDKASEEYRRPGTTDDASSGAELAYTPLAPFLPQGALTVRKASKTMIGEGGWLENTSKRDPTTSPTRGGGFLGNLVKKAKEIIEANHDHRTQRKSRDSDSKSRPTSRQLAISLSPREQSLLYCELEFALASALNDYLTSQFAHGRLAADKLRRVADDWQRKGRPRVVGFRYDLETQLDLVRLHATGGSGGGEFRFYSRAAASVTAVLGVLDTAKANARVLRVRTYCLPDTVVAKQLLDSQGLFNVLGCPEEQQIKLAEVVAFFKAAVERRRVQEQQMLGQQNEVAAMPGAAATSPVRNSRSPTRQGEDWWGTAPAGQLRGSGSRAGGMDPAGYDEQEG